MAGTKAQGKKRVTNSLYTQHRLNPRSSCPFCAVEYAARGIQKHITHCGQNPANRKNPFAELEEIQDGGFVPVGVDLSAESDVPMDPPGFIDEDTETHDVDETHLSHAEDLPDQHSNHEQETQYLDPSKSWISVVWHPSANRPDEIIPLSHGYDPSPPAVPLSSGDVLPPIHADRLPWHPFRTKGDFKFVHMVTTKRMKINDIDEFLTEMHENREWTSKCNLSFKTYKDIEAILSKARMLFPEFKTERLIVNEGEFSFSMTVTYRDPWEWLESLITDPIFAKKINWYPCRKYLHENGSRVRLYDDLETGDNWWNYQTDISPQAEPIPRCYLPIHFWSDKAKVSNQYSMHPVLMRPGFLPSVIRNGNGNGGGVLMAYLPVLPDLEDEASLDEASANKRAIIKRMMYHASIKVLLASLRGPSHHGKIVCCGDSVVRICHPGILAYSMDYEEATYALLNRGVNAHFPDPKSNVPNELQNDLSWIFSRRTTEEMTAAYKRSRECRFAYQMLEVLQSFGTYPIKNSFWDIRNSSLYLGWLYDVLHMDDTSGKGKKIFLLIVEILKAARKESALNQRFSESPSYPQLKHFDRVTDISYTDGNTIFNIIKNLVFCIVDLMPLNSPWVHLVRAYTRFRVLIGLRVMTDTRIALGKKLLEIYDYWAHKVYQQERLSLDYPKHSACRHVFDDIRSAGVTSNYVTKHGESYNAEMKASHNQTNFKDVEKQMWKIDQNHEVLAHMMDGILLHNEMEEAQFAQELADHQEVDPEKGTESEASYSGNAHHRLGSKVSPMQTMNEFETSNAETNGIKDLAIRLAKYLALGHHQIADLPTFQEGIKLSFYRCAYINYESREDFRSRQDIIRCNPSFNGRPRYDTVLVDDTPLRFARVLAIFDWKFHRSSPPLAMALVRYFQPATWTPRTKFERCRVLRERSDTHFIYMSSIIRSCHMPRAFGKDGHYFVNDQTDGDIFLRLEETAI